MRSSVADGEPPFSRTLRISDTPAPGINLFGFLEAESGLGEIARRLVVALERADIPFSAISYRGTPSRQQHRRDLALADEARYDTNVVCLNADTIEAFAAVAGPKLFANRYSIGVWFWETDAFRSEDRSAARFLDEIWVASDYVLRAVESQVDVPVHLVPVPVEAPIGPFRSRADLDLPDAFTFLFLFDFVSAERKNPRGVLEAFARAFAPGEGPVLVLKSINGRERKPRQLDELIAAVGDRPDVIVRDGYVAAVERDSYIAACDCFVSLHRSEGFGLTMAEAMASGKPVVATGYSGNLAFMDSENSYLVSYRLEQIPETWWAHAPGARWAEPDIAEAAQTLRRIYAHADEARARGLTAQREILETSSPGRAGAFVAHRLADTIGHRALRASQSAARAALFEVSRELATKGTGDSLATAGRGSQRGSGFFRRRLRRALWPYLDDQQRFDAAVLEALTTLQRSVEDLERRMWAGQRALDPDHADSEREPVGEHDRRESLH